MRDIEKPKRNIQETVTEAKIAGKQLREMRSATEPNREQMKATERKLVISLTQVELDALSNKIVG